MATKKRKPLFQRTVFHAYEDGTTGQRVADVFITQDGQFEIGLLDYLRYQDCGTLRTTVCAASLADCELAYEKLSEDYSRRILTRDSGKRVLWLGAMTGVSGFPQEVFGLQSLLALGMMSVRQLPDGSMVDDDGVIVGLTINGQAPILLPDTPEVREKIGRLIRSIDTAAEIVGGIRTAADPVAYLLSIPESTVDGGNPVASGVTDPKQIELSLEVASDDNPAPKPPVEDDEEL